MGPGPTLLALWQSHPAAAWRTRDAFFFGPYGEES